MNDTPSSTSLITLMRHGEKDATGKLTRHGFDQARTRGLRLPSLGGEVILLHSGVGRVKDTVRTASAHLHLDENSAEQLELGEHIVDYVSPNLHFLVSLDSKGSYHDRWENAAPSSDVENNQMRDFLRLGDTSPEPGIWLSPKDMAKNVALLLGVEVRFANMTSSPVTFINGTHEPVIMSFLHYFLHNFDPGDADTVTEVGGTTGYAEGLELYIQGKDQLQADVTLRFRGIERRVDLDKVRAFAYGSPGSNPDTSNLL